MRNLKVQKRIEDSVNKAYSKYQGTELPHQSGVEQIKQILSDRSPHGDYNAYGNLDKRLGRVNEFLYSEEFNLKELEAISEMSLAAIESTHNTHVKQARLNIAKITYALQSKYYGEFVKEKAIKDEEQPPEQTKQRNLLKKGAATAAAIIMGTSGITGIASIGGCTFTDYTRIAREDSAMVYDINDVLDKEGRLKQDITKGDEKALDYFKQMHDLESRLVYLRDSDDGHWISNEGAYFRLAEEAKKIDNKIQKLTDISSKEILARKGIAKSLRTRVFNYLKSDLEKSMNHILGNATLRGMEAVEDAGKLFEKDINRFPEEYRNELTKELDELIAKAKAGELGPDPVTAVCWAIGTGAYFTGKEVVNIPVKLVTHPEVLVRPFCTGYGPISKFKEKDLKKFGYFWEVVGRMGIYAFGAYGVNEAIKGDEAGIFGGRGDRHGGNPFNGRQDRE